MVKEAAASDFQGRLPRRTMAERVADHLRNEIQRGALLPGARLRQADLAERFDVSITPVREAFTQLRADGLLRVEPHRGAIVFLPTLEDLRECFLIREPLETLAISRAIFNLTPEVLHELQDIVNEMRKTKDDRRWVELNNQFHLRLYEPAGLPRLQAIISSLRDASSAYLYMFAAARRVSRDKDEEHQNILDACRTRKRELAVRALRLHLRRPVREILKHRPAPEMRPDGPLDLSRLANG